MSPRDTEYMQRALRLAERGLYTTDPNPRVGCVIVNNDQVVGEGWHQRAGEPHAEILALQQAGEEARGASVYVTLEPCSHHGKTPPCADALIDAGVKEVIAAMQDPNPEVSGTGFERLQAHGIETRYGLLEQAARNVNPGFIKRMEAGRPFIRVKLAMSLDGRTAMASGESQWITGKAARADVQKLRARSAVVLSGVDTVLMDDPSLNVRATAAELGIAGKVRQPKRMILDSQLRIKPDAKLFALEGDVVVMTLKQDDGSLPCDVITVAENDGHVDLNEVMAWLVEQQVNEVHVEAGATLTGALLAARLVDEIVVYVAPHIMGHDARGLFNMPELVTMDDRVALEIKDIRQIGKDIRITALPLYN